MIYQIPSDECGIGYDMVVEQIREVVRMWENTDIDATLLREFVM